MKFETLLKISLLLLIIWGLMILSYDRGLVKGKCDEFIWKILVDFDKLTEEQKEKYLEIQDFCWKNRPLTDFLQWSLKLWTRGG